MSKQAEAKIIVLFEDELRLAAAALSAMESDRDASEEVRTLRFKEAIEACWMALYHLTKPESADAVVALSVKRFKFRKEK